jgi:hypothetical protein
MAVPVNNVAPVITGTVEVGDTLACSQGTWSPTPTSYAFQWQRMNDNATDIPGADSSSYVVTADDTGHTLRCKVIATNNTGDSDPAYSAETIEVPDDWFIVEDGTGLSTAVSYVSIADADLYHARRANQTWGNLTVGQKKAALVKATQYLIDRYRKRWQGSRVKTTQALDWPRNWVKYVDYEYLTINGAQVIGGFLYYPANEVPPEVKNACADLAASALTSELYAEQGPVVKREKVGPLETEYSEYSPQGRSFPAIDGRLAVFLTNLGTMLVRR